ncbi:MAG TPA: lactate dehydrogenase, partial [bacterium]|nr:lactate dehydrogenase [bacterium]
KLQKIKERFVSWIWEEGKRAEVFARDYNDQLNAVVKRTYDGPQLDVMTFPGMSAAIRPYRHQKRVAYRIVQNGNTYMAHGVGAGKTIASIMAGMEMKRLGIKKKPMWVVPNHMLKQFSTEFLQLYPAAKILVADEVNFAKQLRNRFMGRVAAENWDGIIITHSAFGLMPMDPDYSAAYIQEQIEELESILQGSRGDRLKRKQIERAKKRLQQRLDKLLAAKNKDKGVTFEESGIDMLFVDEAQEFRKLDFVTEMGQIKGIDSQGSARAHDLFMKTRYLEDLSPGRSLVMMSGTPITNTIGEVYTIQRFLQDEELRRHGLHHFDSWASTFGEMKTQIEATPGGYKAISRFARFRNIATLSKMWGEVGDYVKTSDVPGLVLPTVKTGNRVIVATPQSALQVAYKAELRERVRQIEARGRPPQKGDDIILTVITDGRHAAIDERYIDPRQKPNPESKLEKMTNKVFEIWERTKEDRLTQMIFSDIGVPGSEERRGFSAYKRIKERLIELGVPEKEIAFMQDYKKSNDKYNLFQKMNRGEVRVLIGSSQAMGTGVNAQKKLVALHHLDPDNYLPAWIEQREGRIVRQNNANEMVELYAYVAEGSYDEQMWQFLESKQLFIDEFMRGDATDSEVDDIDGAANSYATAKAMASDNPLWLEKAALENEIAKLELLKRAHTDEQVGLRQRYAFAKSDLAHHEETVEKLKAIIKALPDMSGDKFSIVIGKNTFNDRKSAGEELAKIVWKNAEKLAIGEHTNNTVIGSYAGMPLSASILASESWHSQRFTGGKADELERRIRYELSISLTTSDNAYTVASSGDIEKDKDPIGLIARIENLLGQFEQRRARSEERAAEHAKFIKDAQEKINSPFAHQASLDSKLTRIEEINKELTAEEGMSPGGVGDLVVDEDAQDVDLERRQPVGESEAILTGQDVGPLLHSLSKRVKGLEVTRDEGGNYYIK